MDRKLLVILSFLIIFNLITAYCYAADEILLRFNLKEGKTYSMEMKSNQEISQTIQGQQIDMTQIVGMSYTYNVKKVDYEGNMTVEVVYDSVYFKQEGPMGQVEYDSANPDTDVPPLARGFAGLVGQKFTMEMTPMGIVKNVRGVDGLITNIVKQLNIADSNARISLEESLREQFGEEAMKDTLEKMTAIFPEGPVTIGESWTKKVEITTGTPMILDNTWTLKDRKEGVAFIQGDSVIRSNPEVPSVERGSMGINYELSGKQEGMIQVDEKTGWTIRGKLNQDFSGQVNIEKTEQMQDSLSWPISIKSTITLEPMS